MTPRIVMQHLNQISGSKWTGEAEGVREAWYVSNVYVFKRMNMVALYRASGKNRVNNRKTIVVKAYHGQW